MQVLQLWVIRATYQNQDKPHTLRSRYISCRRTLSRRQCKHHLTISTPCCCNTTSNRESKSIAINFFFSFSFISEKDLSSYLFLQGFRQDNLLPSHVLPSLGESSTC